MSSIRSKYALFLGTLLLGANLAMTAAFAAGNPQTFTGKVTDAMCGANHAMMPGEPSECVRSCVKKGSKYALVVGEKVYSLDASDRAALSQLDKLADQQAKVTGQANGDTIAVASVADAK